MTTKELKTVEQLTSLVSSLIEENKKFREQITEEVAAVTKKVDKKHAPLNLEEEILRASQSAISTAISGALTGYGSPLTKLVTGVVEEQNEFLREIISSSFNEIIRTPDFKQSILNSFSHKVAKSIISGNDSLFQKVVNDMKQDPVFRSRMTLAVSTVVEECLKEGKIDKI